MLLLLSYEIDMWFLRQLMKIQVVMHNERFEKERFEEVLNRDSPVREPHHDWLPPSVGNQEYQHWTHQFGGSQASNSLLLRQ